MLSAKYPYFLSPLVLYLYYYGLLVLGTWSYWLIPGLCSMESRAPSILAVNILFFVLTWIAVLLRVYVRASMLSSFGVDDGLMVITLLFFTSYLICQLGGLAHGTGRHMSDLAPAQALIALRVG